MKAARKEKSVYVTRDTAGQRVIEAQPVPFIITSMGLLCSEAHDMLRLCYRLNPRATTALQDCLAVQHAKWIAHRLFRGVGPHRTSSAGPIPPPAPAPPPSSGRGKQRGHLRRFNNMFCSPTDVSASAAPSGSHVGSARAQRGKSSSQPSSNQYSTDPAARKPLPLTA